MHSKLPNPTRFVRVGAIVMLLTSLAMAEPPREPSVRPVSSTSVGDIPADGSEPPQSIVEQAILALEKRHSVSARIRQSIHLFGQNPIGTGIYAEQRSADGMRFRLELRIQTGNESASLVEVCDGRFLWKYSKLHEEETLHRIDVLRVRQALVDAEKMPQPGKIGDWPGLGGLSRSLRGLNDAFQFTSCRPLPSNQPFRGWQVEGRWKPEKLDEWFPKGNLPDHLPDRVILSLGEEDLFPFRIEFQRSQANTSKGQGGGNDRTPARTSRNHEGHSQSSSPFAQDLTHDSLMVVEFFEVGINVPVHPTRFIYQPGDLDFSDGTGRFIERLGILGETDR